MRVRLSVAAGLAAAMAMGPALLAQKTTEVHPGRGGSPHVKTEYTIDGANLSITYGRPVMKGRDEATLMPPGKPWRTGADETTRLATDRAIAFGDLKLEPGTYTINTIPGDEWTLLIGRLAEPSEKRPVQWGIPYQPDLEIGKVPMSVSKTASPVEQLTITIEDTAEGATLRIEWGTVRAEAPFTIATN